MQSSDALKMMQYDANKKSVGLAYVLLVLLGGLGAHRFYLKRTGSAVVLLVLAGAAILWAFFSGFVAIGTENIVGALASAMLLPLVIALWLIVDLFRVPSMVRKHNNDLAARMEVNVTSR